MPPWASQSYGDTAASARKLAGKSLYTLGSTLCSAARTGAAVAKAAAAGIQTLTSHHGDKERVLWARVGQIEWKDPAQGSDRSLPVCLLGYDTGFQVWSLEEMKPGGNETPAELVSVRRDGAVRWLEPVPQPRLEDPPDGPLHDTRPLLAVVPAPSGGDALDGNHHAAQQQHRVQLYSLRSQGYVHTLCFNSEVLGVLCSSRVVVVALRGRLQAYDALTMESTFSCVTFCPPPSRQQQQQQLPAEQRGTQQEVQQDAALGPLVGAPCALGPRWLAYAADQAVQPNGSQAKAQRIPLNRRDSASSSSSLGAGFVLPSRSPSIDAAAGMGSGSPGSALTSAAVAEAAKEYAKKSGQHLAAGLAAAGSAGYKYFSSQYRTWRSGAQQGALGQQGDAAAAGTVMVRDVVTRQVVCHFRAHTSALATMQFTPDGTMLATASVHGHNVNIFRIIPPTPSFGAGQEADGAGAGLGGVGGQGGACGYAQHLFRLHRGVTPGLIQSISFAPDASWAAVTSGRGTNHVFHLAAAAAPGSPLAARVASSPLDSLQQPSPGGVDATAVGAPLHRAGGEDGGWRQPPSLEEGVTGQPLKLVAVGRAGGKAGLLGSGIAGVATQAALSVYGQQAEVWPAAAAFLPNKPSSPRALASPVHLPSQAGAGLLSLMVVSWEGQLTRHMLRTPGTLELCGSPAAAPPINAHYPAGSGTSGPAGDARQVAALQEDARWDICRQHGWQEREEIPLSLLPAPPASQAPVDIDPTTGAVLGGTALGGPHAGDACSEGRGSMEGEQAAAAVDPSWLAQAEGAPSLDPSLAPPLWADPQFRFVPLSFQPQHQQPLRTMGSPCGYPGISTSPGHTRSSSGALYSRSPPAGGFLHHGQAPAGMASGFGAEYCRPGSSLSSASSEVAVPAHWGHR